MEKWQKVPLRFSAIYENVIDHVSLAGSLINCFIKFEFDPLVVTDLSKGEGVLVEQEIAHHWISCLQPAHAVFGAIFSRQIKK